jgi:sulfopropanediol 3-dehydrogenase
MSVAIFLLVSCGRDESAMNSWPTIDPAGVTYVKRPEAPAHAHDVTDLVTRLIEQVRTDGVDAVRRLSAEFDRWEPERFEVSLEEREAAVESLEDRLADEIHYALSQVRTFARHQLDCLRPLDVEIQPGVHLGHRLHPIRSVGAYVPGGRYPLIASAFMTIGVAKAAGVDRVHAAAPPRDANGIDPVQLAAMHLAGADRIFAVGGVQALAAMALGVGEFAPGVDMLVGAGNVYVTEAKRQLFGEVGIDALAGPSELTILADDTADAELLAMDLLGQAEHGPTSEVVLVTTSERVARAVLDAIPAQLATLPTRETAEVAWRDYGAVIVCDTREAAVAEVNRIAPEHLEVQASDPSWYFERLDAYGTIFLGADATVAFSDKAIGTNHVLPTGRTARFTGGLWVGSFIRVLTHQRVDPGAGEAVATATMAIAGAEGLAGHVRSARARLRPQGGDHD